MFIHIVLFRIAGKHVKIYKKDCRMWAKEASRHPGFLGYHTLLRVNEKDQYASFYLWKRQSDHVGFMKKHHDRLVSLSQCPVKVLGYYNFQKVSSD